jgi:hypothetical protein
MEAGATGKSRAWKPAQPGNRGHGSRRNREIAGMEAGATSMAFMQTGSLKRDVGFDRIGQSETQPSISAPLKGFAPT